MRKTFRCRFNSYVGLGNRDSVIGSLIAQFQSYDCNIEATLDGNELILSLDLVNGLTSTLVRDKLAFNYFIENVRIGDSIKKYRMTLPTPVSSWVESKVVGEEYMKAIRKGDLDDWELYDDGARPDMVKLVGGSKSNVVSSWIKHADPRGNLIVPPFSGTDDVVDTDLLSDVNDVTATKIATEQDGGGLAGFGGGIEQTNVRTSPTKPPRRTKPPQPSILGVPTTTTTTSWFTDDILAGETVTPNPDAEAPLQIVEQSRKIASKNLKMNVAGRVPFEDSALKLPGADQGGEYVPGEDIEGWFTAFRQVPTYLGLNDHYESDESDDNDDYEL